MNKIFKSTLGVAAAAVTLGVSVAQGTVSAWSWGDNTPSGNGRESHTVGQINDGVLGDEIVFNTISDSVIGDEKNFVATREDTGSVKGQTHTWNSDVINVEDGKTYIIRLYVHNNNPGGMDAVATGVRTVFSIDQSTAEQLSVFGRIDMNKADNVKTTRYWDDVVFKSNNGQKFHLDFVSGSGLIENNRVTASLSDDIFNTENGVQIGYDARLNGEIPGCYDYDSFVSIKVKAVFENQTASDFTVEKKVRRVGEKNWVQYIEGLKVGDKVEYQIHYHNSSNVESTNVMVQDILPANMKYVNGTAKLFDSLHQNGDALEDAVVTTGVNIGGYAANGDGYVRFTAEVVDDSLYCGTTKLVNWSKVSVGNATAKDSADVYVDKTCADNTPQTPKTGETEKMPATGPEGVIGAVIGAGALTTAGGFYLRSRKK